MSSLGDVRIGNGIVLIVTATDKWVNVDGALTTSQRAVLTAKAKVLLRELEAHLDMIASNDGTMQPGEFISWVNEKEAIIENGGVV